jgi:hypothetical protein
MVGTWGRSPGYRNVAALVRFRLHEPNDRWQIGENKFGNSSYRPGLLLIVRFAYDRGFVGLVFVVLVLVINIVIIVVGVSRRLVLTMMMTGLHSTNQVEEFSGMREVMSAPVGCRDNHSRRF